MRFLKITVIAVLLVVVVFSFTACGDKTETYTDLSGKWQYTTATEDGIVFATLTEYLGDDANVVIPATIKDKEGMPVIVNALGEGLFVKYNEKGVYTDNNSLVTVTIDPASMIEVIPYRAFYCCRKLTSVTFNENKLTKIMDFAFYGCSSLTEITITKNVNALGGYTFRECTSLNKVVILSEITVKAGDNKLAIPSIGDKCFYCLDPEASDDDQYFIKDDLKIYVKDVSLYNRDVIEANRKALRTNDYKYWMNYEGHLALLEA